MIRRFSSRTLTGIARREVAVGSSRLASMLATIREATPVMVSRRSSLAARASAATGAGAESDVAVEPFPSPPAGAVGSEDARGRSSRDSK
jgi:hypothetical protein